MVIDFIKCKLLNNNLSSGSYNISNIEFNLELNEEIVYVQINSKKSENLIIYLIKNEDSYEIRDYQSFAYESLGLKSLTNLSNSLK